MPERLLKINEVAAILRISERSIYNRVRPGSVRPFPIPVKRIGRVIRFRMEDVEAFLTGESEVDNGTNTNNPA